MSSILAVWYPRRAKTSRATSRICWRRSAFPTGPSGSTLTLLTGVSVGVGQPPFPAPRLFTLLSRTRLRYQRLTDTSVDLRGGMAKLAIGMDVGSTTVKAVVLDPVSKEILWSDYQRHHTKQPEYVLSMLEAITGAFPSQPTD